MAIIGIIVLFGILLTLFDEKMFGKLFVFIIGFVLFCILTICTGGLFLFFRKTYMKNLLSIMIS